MRRQTGGPSSERATVYTSPPVLEPELIRGGHRAETGRRRLAFLFLGDGYRTIMLIAFDFVSFIFRNFLDDV